MAKFIEFKKSRYVPTIKYIGILNYENLLKTGRNWIADQGFEFHEKSVKHKVPSPIGAEQEFEWWGWRKVNTYIKYHVDVFIHTWDLHDVEVIRESKKQKLQSAKIWIEITGRCELDWASRFGGSRFLQALADFYDNYIIRKNLDNIWTDQLYYHIYKLHGVLKEYLDMETKASAYQDVW